MRGLIARGPLEKDSSSTSLLRHGIYTISFDLNVALRFGTSIGVATHKTMANPTVNCYQDKDQRWFWLIGLESERHWPNLCRSIEKPEWITDSRFVNAQVRRDNRDELTGLLDKLFSTKTRDQWGEIFDREDMWWAPVQTPEEVLADPQVLAGGGFVNVPDGPDTTTMINSPIDYLGTPGGPRSMPPDLGEHTDSVLASLGYSSDEISKLRLSGVIA